MIMPFWLYGDAQMSDFTENYLFSQYVNSAYYDNALNKNLERKKLLINTLTGMNKSNHV